MNFWRALPLLSILVAIAIVSVLFFLFYFGYLENDALVRHAIGLDIGLKRAMSLAAIFLALIFGLNIVAGGHGRRYALATASAVLIAILGFAAWDGLAYSRPEKSSVAFREWTVAENLGYAYGVFAADYDGDGKLDLSLSDSWVEANGEPRGAKVHILWDGRDRETIVDRETFDFSQSPVRDVYLFERHVAVDVNGDGRLDIAGVVNSHDAIVAYINPGSRGQRWARAVLSNRTPGAVNLASADIDDDGDQDLYVSMRRQSRSYPVQMQGIIWLENPGTPGEWRCHNIDTSRDFEGTRTVQAGDIDRDGKVDVLVSDARTGLLAWYGRRGDAWVRHPLPNLDARNAHFGKLFDMNHDQRLDLVMPHRGGVSWLENKGDDEWETHRIARFPTYGEWRNNVISEIAVGDIDGDSRPDVAISVSNPYYAPHGQVLWAQNHDDYWSLHILKDRWSRAVNIRVSDVNGDGRNDIIVVGEYEQQSVKVFENLRTKKANAETD